MWKTHECPQLNLIAFNVIGSSNGCQPISSLCTKRPLYPHANHAHHLSDAELFYSLPLLFSSNPILDVVTGPWLGLRCHDLCHGARIGVTGWDVGLGRQPNSLCKKYLNLIKFLVKFLYKLMRKILRIKRKIVFDISTWLIDSNPVS